MLSRVIVVTITTFGTTAIKRRSGPLTASANNQNRPAKNAIPAQVSCKIKATLLFWLSFSVGSLAISNTSMTAPDIVATAPFTPNCLSRELPNSVIMVADAITTHAKSAKSFKFTRLLNIPASYLLSGRERVVRPRSCRRHSSKLCHYAGGQDGPRGRLSRPPRAPPLCMGMEIAAVAGMTGRGVAPRYAEGR